MVCLCPDREKRRAAFVDGFPERAGQNRERSRALKESIKLRRSLIAAALALLAALFSVSAATFAWYVYNTSARTTEVKMSAGSSLSLQIASARDGTYRSYTSMENFQGRLNPVSTDKISGGFQRAEWFDRMVQPGGRERLFAALFGQGVENVDYHKTSLFLKTNAAKMDIYLAAIVPDNVPEKSKEIPPPIAAAMRLGLVVKQADEFGNYPEYIFEVTSKASPYRGRSDNGDRFPGEDHVLDSVKTDGSTVVFRPYNSDNFCDYNANTGKVTLKDNSLPLFTLTNEGGSGDGYGAPVEVEVYLWLEGCDLDCTRDIAGTTLETLTLSFAGVERKGVTENG